MRNVIHVLFVILALRPDFASGFDYETLTARLFYFKGEVLIKTLETEFAPVEKGELISAGDTLKTSSKSLAIISLPDGSKLKLGESTEITLEKLVERIEGESFGKTSIIMRAGRVLIDVINKGKEPVFEIKTKNVALGVRGTRFFAGFDKNDQGENDLWASVERGEIVVQNLSNNQTADALENGQGMIIEGGKTFTQPQKYNWVRDMNYDASSKDEGVGHFQKIKERRKREFSKRRQNWKRNQARWKKKKEIWSRFKAQYKKKLEKFHAIRAKFIERRKKFNQERKNLIKQKGDLIDQAKSLKGQSRKLRKKRQQLVGKMRKANGSNSPNEKNKIRRQLLELKKKGKELRDARGKILVARKKLIEKRDQLIQFKRKETGEIKKIKQVQQSQKKLMQRQLKKQMEKQQLRDKRRRRRPPLPNSPAGGSAPPNSGTQ